MPFNTQPLLACDTTVNVTISFGGKNWVISPADFQLSQLTRTQCLGAFFELATGSSAPSWIVGDTFLVRLIYFFFHRQVNPALLVHRKMFIPSSAMTHFQSDLLNSPIQLWARAVSGKLLPLLSVLSQRLSLLLLLGALRQNFNPLQALWTTILLKRSLLWWHFVLPVLLLPDTCFSLAIWRISVILMLNCSWWTCMCPLGTLVVCSIHILLVRNVVLEALVCAVCQVNQKPKIPGLGIQRVSGSGLDGLLLAKICRCFS